MKVRVVMDRMGYKPEYIRRMQQDLFDTLAKARGQDELRMIEPMAKEVRERYIRELRDARHTRAGYSSRG